ncbi:hypothetical protein [Oceanobacillus timonensis]|uniref:hypothetical protein n=1 Tax=Oceanobacillus timonensis TaxID=1926285 RepID=UPI0009B9B81A|nr:hypothetical protein [Oceanobacillus timonensis]
MMNKNSFQFSEIPNIEVATFDNSLGDFYASGIEGTIKEDIQNALDARLEKDLTVKLKISLENVNKGDLPGINEVFERINTLQGSNSYTADIIDYMKAKTDVTSVPVLTIEDNNTKGLTGAMNGQSNSKKDTFGIYAYSKGVHFTEENKEEEISRGGSHGIGKISNNAASDIHLMYFANCDEYGYQHLGGNTQLIEHTLNGKSYRSTGYFSYIQGEDGKRKLYPFENKGYSSTFTKSTRGLKIIIPYIREEFNKMERIVKAVCDNFFLAVLQKKLEVEIKDSNQTVLISYETISDLVASGEFFETDKEQMVKKKSFTPLYIQTYLKNEPIELTVSNNTEEYTFSLYFTYDEEIPAGRVGILRTIGMKIEDFKVKNNVRKPFNALLLGGTKEDEYLKSLENESHTKITEENIRDVKEKRNAKKFINNLNKELSKVIDEYFNRNNQTDGLVDTKDLLFETENNFKSELTKMSEKISIDNEQTLIKKKVKETRKRRNQQKSDFNSESINSNIRKPRKIKKSNEDTSIRETIIAPAGIVQRAIIGSNELLQINLNQIENGSQWRTCNISFKVIDGMGNELDNEFDLENFFNSNRFK